ncbi:MAG: glycosyl transferase group 1 [Phycisphaerales bacterium]|nr:glycosyl transferase group 1 [Phycisphaerales bacterium]
MLCRPPPPPSTRRRPAHDDRGIATHCCRVSRLRVTSHDSVKIVRPSCLSGERFRLAGGCVAGQGTSLGRRRILFIDHTARLGGGEIALFNMIRALDLSQYEPMVLLFSTGSLYDKLVSAGIPVRVLPLHAAVVEARKDSLGPTSLFRLKDIVKTLWFTRRVKNLIKELRPAIVHTNSLKADIIGGFAAKWTGVPLIWHVRDRIEPDYLTPMAVPIFRWLAQRVPDLVICNSQATRRTLSPLTRAVVVPSGVVLQPEADRLGQSSSASHGDTKRDLMVGLVGRLAAWKGQHIFIDAISRIWKDFPHARFQIIGSALFGEVAYEHEIRDLVRKCGLEQVVQFTGFRPDIGEAIAALDIVVHASITEEPFGQTVVEGMAAGKPVVATRGGGVVDIVQDGITGLLVSMGDAAAMAAALSSLMSDPRKRAEMGRLGRERVKAHFTIEHTAAMVADAYEQLLQPSIGAAADGIVAGPNHH